MDMDNFKQLPQIVCAAANQYNTPMLMADSRGNQYQVPATWWLVEFTPNLVVLMPNETFTAQYERSVVAVPMEDFANTVSDLRNSDRMAVQRAMELETRIASLEGLLSPGGRFGAESVLAAIVQIRAAVGEVRTETNTRLAAMEAWVSSAANLSARLGAVEALVSAVSGAFFIQGLNVSTANVELKYPPVELNGPSNGSPTPNPHPIQQHQGA